MNIVFLIALLFSVTCYSATFPAPMSSYLNNGSVTINGNALTNGASLTLASATNIFAVSGVLSLSAEGTSITYGLNTNGWTFGSPNALTNATGPGVSIANNTMTLNTNGWQFGIAGAMTGQQISNAFLTLSGGTINGSLTVRTNLTVFGTTTLSNFVVHGTATINHDTTVNGNLTVNGTTYYYNTIYNTTNIYFGSTTNWIAWNLYTTNNVWDIYNTYLATNVLNVIGGWFFQNSYLDASNASWVTLPHLLDVKGGNLSATGNWDWAKATWSNPPTNGWQFGTTGALTNNQDNVTSLTISNAYKSGTNTVLLNSEFATVGEVDTKIATALIQLQGASYYGTIIPSGVNTNFQLLNTTLSPTLTTNTLAELPNGSTYIARKVLTNNVMPVILAGSYTHYVYGWYWPSGNKIATIQGDICVVRSNSVIVLAYGSSSTLIPGVTNLYTGATELTTNYTLQAGEYFGIERVITVSGTGGTANWTSFLGDGYPTRTVTPAGSVPQGTYLNSGSVTFNGVPITNGSVLVTSNSVAPVNFSNDTRTGAVLISNAFGWAAVGEPDVSKLSGSVEYWPTSLTTNGSNLVGFNLGSWSCTNRNNWLVMGSPNESVAQGRALGLLSPSTNTWHRLEVLVMCDLPIVTSQAYEYIQFGVYAAETTNGIQHIFGWDTTGGRAYLTLGRRQSITQAQSPDTNANVSVANASINWGYGGAGFPPGGLTPVWFAVDHNPTSSPPSLKYYWATGVSGSAPNWSLVGTITNVPTIKVFGVQGSDSNNSKPNYLVRGMILK